LCYIFSIVKKNWPILVLGALLIAIIGVSCYANPSYQDKQNRADNSSPVAGITKTEATQRGQYTQPPERPPVWRRILTWPEGDTALAIFLTLWFIAWQAFLTRQAIVSSEASSKAQLRAYLGVMIATGSYQERDKGIKFDGSPVLENTGKTPAHNVRYRNNVAIIKEPIPPGYIFSPGQNEIGPYVLGIHLPVVMATVMDDFCDQQDVASIMKGTEGRALYCWGKILYDDAFGESHETEFCHRMFFVENSEKPGTYNVRGNYVAGRNKAT
jgi:hypothetical protein